MSLIKKLDDFEIEFTKCWKEYLDLHKQLDAYRGKDLKDLYEEVNVLLNKIQDSYINMHPAFAFILNRAKMCDDAIENHRKFVEALKVAGASEHPAASA